MFVWLVADVGCWFVLREKYCCLVSDAQRENPCLPCVKIFAVRFISGARQKACLPCVFYIAHGKEKTHAKQVVCRAPRGKRTTKILFAVRFYYSARQSIFSLVKILCRAHYFRRTAFLL
jgi:hypothetical protein